MIDPLTPQQIAGVYGRSNSIFARRVLLGLQPKVFIVWYSVVLFAGLLVWTAIGGVLLGDDKVPWALGLFGENPGRPQQVRLPLFLDPVGMVVIVTALAIPLFCAEQVAAIAAFNAMNERNMTYRLKRLDDRRINNLVRLSNKWFSLVGSRTISGLILVASVFNSYTFITFTNRIGFLQSWNPSLLSDAEWRRLVYRGWWANPDTHPAFALALILIGAYFFYHVTKQLAMGFIFAVYAGLALKHDFGVAPNLALNTDGYHGLRSLRYFMQWTYVVTILDFLMMIGILVVWLPFSQVTVFLLLLVVATNVLTVLYPTSVAVGGSLLEKRMYVQHLSSTAPTSELDRLVERTWNVPHLPFRVRGTLGVVTLYLLIPIILALVSALLQ